VSPLRDGSVKVGAIDALAPTIDVIASVQATVAPRSHDLILEDMFVILFVRTQMPMRIVAQKKIDKPRCASRLLTIFFSPSRSMSYT
jgi:hypothetical protein